MSTDDKVSKTPATIKIAAKSASQRATNGGADPGPGDMSAAPSEMPEPVNVPQPPTPSELVVKSTKTVNSRAIKTINDPVSLPKSRKSSASTKLTSTKPFKPTSRSGQDDDGNEMGPEGAAREPTSSKALSSSGKTIDSLAGPVGSALGSSRSRSKSQHSTTSGSAVPSAKSLAGASESRATFEGSAKGVQESASAGANADASVVGGPSAKTVQSASGSAEPGPSGSNATQVPASPGQEHDQIDEGETVIEHPSPSPSPSGAGSTPSPEPGIDSAPPSSGGGGSKMSSKTSVGSKKPSRSGKTKSASSASSASSHGSHHGKHDGKNKKVTKFRYHKRVTVRTHGKTNPSTIMNKVNEKDHKAGITPSNIEDMDTEELMKRAGIKGNKKTHWKVRLRQTKRISKGGKTVTQTKIAYRDSEGNKRVKTSLSPYCKTCGKKVEDCKCDEPQK